MTAAAAALAVLALLVAQTVPAAPVPTTAEIRTALLEGAKFCPEPAELVTCGVPDDRAEVYSAHCRSDGVDAEGHPRARCNTRYLLWRSSGPKPVVLMDDPGTCLPFYYVDYGSGAAWRVEIWLRKDLTC